MDNTISRNIGAGKALERDDTLKAIAIITMLIDHIGYLFFPVDLYPNLIILRIIGRLSYPIFAYQIALGYTRTRDIKKYFKRLIIFSIISQIPYFYFSPGNLNIMPTLAFGLFTIYLYDKGYKPFAFLAIGIGDILLLQYGGYGIAMILLFYVFRDDKLKTIIAYTILTILFYFISNGNIQYFSIISLLFILTNVGIKIKLNKHIAYLFYPVHISILLIIKYYII